MRLVRTDLTLAVFASLALTMGCNSPQPPYEAECAQFDSRVSLGQFDYAQPSESSSAIDVISHAFNVAVVEPVVRPYGCDTSALGYCTQFVDTCTVRLPRLENWPADLRILVHNLGNYMGTLDAILVQGTCTNIQPAFLTDGGSLDALAVDIEAGEYVVFPFTLDEPAADCQSEFLFESEYHPTDLPRFRLEMQTDVTQ